jgi:hypothetical protein
VVEQGLAQSVGVHEQLPIERSGQQPTFRP